MTPGSLPPLGRCALCGHRRHVSEHRSTRDRLLRLLCTPCYSGACLREEAGHPVDWDQALATGSDAELERWLGGEL
ncbi:hypothetical protein [Streptomyces collinus]